MYKEISCPQKEVSLHQCQFRPNSNTQTKAQVSLQTPVAFNILEPIFHLPGGKHTPPLKRKK